MPAERYYIPQSLTPHSTLDLQDHEFHHLVRVMRARVGDVVEVINGQGVLATATVEKIGKHSASLYIAQAVFFEKEAFSLILAQAIPKPNRLETILEKATELGAAEIWLFPSTTSAKKDFSQNQMERMQFITIGAMKQCGRLYLPPIAYKDPLLEWTALPSPAFFGDVAAAARPLWQVWADGYQHSSQALFCIGPESGLTDREEAHLVHLGALGVKLHHNILRTDTAAIVALSLIQHWRL